MLHQPKGKPLHATGPAQPVGGFPGNSVVETVCAKCAASHGMGGTPMNEVEVLFRSEEGWVNICPFCGTRGTDADFVRVAAG